MSVTLDVIENSNAPKVKMDVSEIAFGRPYNEALIHQIVTAYLAGARQGTRAQKTRAEVSGGGIKPWKQKGSGRARAGTLRSPIWRKGGVTFAAKPQDHSQKVNKKMYKGAMRSILSELARQSRLSVVEAFNIEQPMTKLAIEKLKELGLSNALVISHEVNENQYLALRNLKNVDIRTPSEIDPVALLRHEHVLVTKTAVKEIEEMLG